MSLDFDTTEIANYEENFPDKGSDEQPRCKGVTAGIVFHANFSGFRAITEDNYEDVAARIVAWENAVGPFLTMRDEDGKVVGKYRITLEDVRLHIGLWTNANERSVREFEKQLGSTALYHARQTINPNRRSWEGDPVEEEEEEEAAIA